MMPAAHDENAATLVAFEMAEFGNHTCAGGWLLTMDWRWIACPMCPQSARPDAEDHTMVLHGDEPHLEGMSRAEALAATAASNEGEAIRHRERRRVWLEQFDTGSHKCASGTLYHDEDDVTGFSCPFCGGSNAKPK
jgi:hypothetical protein